MTGCHTSTYPLLTPADINSSLVGSLPPRFRAMSFSSVHVFTPSMCTEHMLILEHVPHRTFFVALTQWVRLGTYVCGCHISTAAIDGCGAAVVRGALYNGTPCIPCVVCPTSAFSNDGKPPGTIFVLRPSRCAHVLKCGRLLGASHHISLLHSVYLRSHTFFLASSLVGNSYSPNAPLY